MIKFGIIGFGYTGQQHAKALSSLEGVVLAGVAETDSGKRSKAGTLGCKNYQSLIDDDQIDAVSICLPHALHEDVATSALEAGKHVLVEKPLAASVAAGARLCELAKTHSRILMVEMTHRFLPPLSRARQLVQDRTIGEILAVQDVVVESFGLFGSLPQWMFNRSLSAGGVGLTSGIHLIDHVSWVTGLSLRLDSANFGFSQRLGDVEDTASFSLHLENGAPVQILLCLRADGSPLEGRLNVYGSKGTLRVEPWHGWWLEFKDRVDEEVSFEPALSIAERALVGMQGAISEFLSAIRGNRQPDPRPEESLESQRIIERAYNLTGAGSQA